MMTISCTYDQNGKVVFTDNAGAARTVSPDWAGDMRMQAVDGGGVVGFLGKGGTINPYVAPVIDLSAADLAALNAVLAEPGSVVRALGLVMFAEINKLRVAGGAAAYTMPQFVVALKAQMR